jgi:hypothetical protein
MTTLLPQDDNNTPIPTMRLRPNGAHSISATETSARNTVAFAPSTRVISLYATDDVYIRFGDATVTATNSDHFFPGNTYYDFSISNGRDTNTTHLAVIAAAESCTVYISEKH